MDVVFQHFLVCVLLNLRVLIVDMLEQGVEVTDTVTFSRRSVSSRVGLETTDFSSHFPPHQRCINQEIVTYSGPLKQEITIDNALVA